MVFLNAFNFVVPEKYSSKKKSPKKIYPTFF